MADLALGTCAVCGRKAIHPTCDRCYRHRRSLRHGAPELRPKSGDAATCSQGGCRNVPAPGRTICEECRTYHSEKKRREYAGAKAARDYLAEQWARNGAGAKR